MTSDNVNEYTLTAPFDVSTAVFVRLFLSGITRHHPHPVWPSSADGSKMFVVGYDSDNVNEYTLAAQPFDVSTAVFVRLFLSGITRRHLQPAWPSLLMEQRCLL